MKENFDGTGRYPFNGKKMLVAAILGGLVVISACSKDNDNTPPVVDPVPPTSAELIVANTWKIDTIGFDSDNNGSIDVGVPGGFKACDLDNVLKFTKDSTGVFDEGALKCDDLVPQSLPFVWSLVKTDSVINFQGKLPGELNGDLKILSISDSSFVMSKPVTLGLASTTLIISLKK